MVTMGIAPIKVHYYYTLLGGVYVPCIHRMPGEIIVSDSGLCCCGPAINVMCDVNCSSAMTSHCLLFQVKSSQDNSSQVKKKIFRNPNGPNMIP